MAEITITITDVDLDAGQYKAAYQATDTLEHEGRYTAAHMLGAYIMNQINDPAFAQAVWDFAQKTVESQNGCSIVNPEARPGGAD